MTRRSGAWWHWNACWRLSEPTGRPAGDGFSRLDAGHAPSATLSRKRESAVNGSFNNILPLAGGSAGLRGWRAGECAELQGGDIGCFNGRPGRVSLWRLAVGVANHFTLTSLTLDSPASGRVQFIGACKQGPLLFYHLPFWWSSKNGG